MAKFTKAIRCGDGFVDIDEEDAILDLQKVFEKRMIDKVAGLKAVHELVNVAKVFFVTLGAVSLDAGAAGPLVVDEPEKKTGELKRDIATEEGESEEGG